MRFLSGYQHSDKEIYIFVFGGAKLSAGLKNRALQGLIQPSARLPRKRRGRDPVGNTWIIIDLTKAVSQISQQLNVNAGQYIPHLERLFDLIRLLPEGHLSQDQTLPEILNALSVAYKAHGRRRWEYVLEDFVFFTRLLGDDILCGSKPLRDGLTKWLVSACWEFAMEAPLSVSLQFVDLCTNNTAFETAMQQLIYNLSLPKVVNLINTQGDIDLSLSGAPSNRIMAFMRKYYGFDPYGPTPMVHPLYDQLTHHPVHYSPVDPFGWNHH